LSVLKRHRDYLSKGQFVIEFVLVSIVMGVIGTKMQRIFNIDKRARKDQGIASRY